MHPRRLPLWRTPGLLRAPALALALALCPAPTRAAEPTPAEQAVTLGHEGLALFQKGALAEAYERFRQAEERVHSPVFLLHMARAKRGLGDLLTAREHALRVARDPLPAGAPPSWLAAQADGVRELAELDAAIPSLRVELASASEGLTVTLDGAVVEASALGGPIPQNPGEHTLVARATDGREARATVRLAADGEATTVRLSLAPPATRAAAPPSVPVRPAPPPKEGSWKPGVVVLGVGAIGLGVGVGAGLSAQSKAEDVLSRCDGNDCLASDEALAGDAESLATVSTVGFVAAAIAVPAGVALLVWRPFGAEEPAVTVAASPLGLRVRGAF